ncbi:MAG TPA: copper resistance protein CopZ [Devosia sp.]|nr:copper resistance protein CopZ [Devosia sp.]
MRFVQTILALAFLALLAACQNDVTTPKPEPAILSEDDIGHSDQMIVMNHVGPRAQVHIAGRDEPLWFSSVRDGLVYLRSPEQTAKILAVYVNDIGVAQSWDEMGVGNWIDAETAFYVVGSDAKGGMGAPEFVPFSDEEKAQDFSSERGGEILGLGEITAEMVLAPLEHSEMQMPSMNGESDVSTMENMSPGGG